ncbi:hypothetical protein [Nocardioides pacificus]
MSRLLGVRLLAVTLTAAVALGAPIAAHAERVVAQDPAGDVIYQDVNEMDEEEGPLAVTPDNTAVDITRTIVNHRAHRLRLTMRLRDLRSRGLLYTAFEVSTPKQTYALIAVRHGGRRTNVQTFLETRGSEVKCRGLRVSLDSQTDAVTASVPSKCLNSPRWVKIGAATYTVKVKADGTDVRSFSDDAHQAGVSSGDALSYPLAMGTKVRRS